MLRLAIRNVWRHGYRSALTLAAISLGVAGLILAGGFVKDVLVQLGEATIHSQLGHLQIFRTGYYEHGVRKPLEFGIPRASALATRVRANPAVQDVMLRLDFSGLLNNGRSDLAITGEGIEPDREARLGSYVTILRGRSLKASDRFGMLIGEGVAKALNLAPGDPVTLVASTASGSLNNLDLSIVGVFRSFSKDYDNRAVRIPIEAAQTLLDTDAANAAVVLLHRTSDTQRVRREIEQSLAGSHIEIKTWDELSDFYTKTIALYERQFGVLQIIVAAMVVLSVMNSISMTTFERAGEFGTMRALGDADFRIVRLLILEGALLGAMGAVVGLALGCLLAWVVSAIGIPMPPPPNAESGYTAFIRIVPRVLAMAATIGIGAAIAATVVPACRVVRMPLAEALRQNG